MITAAAIRAHDGAIYTGRTHADAMENMPPEHRTPALIMAFARGEVQGFVDEYGVFLGRELAYGHAVVCGQIQRRPGDDGRLRSERLKLGVAA